MSLKAWEKRVFKDPGLGLGLLKSKKLRLAAGLSALREQAGSSQWKLALRMGIPRRRVAATVQSRNVTIDVREQYADAIGGRLEVMVVKGRE